MESINYIIILIVVLYLVKDKIKGKTPWYVKKYKLLTIVDTLFFVAVLLIVLMGETDLIYDYWWALILAGLPSLYLQYLILKQDEEPSLSKWTKVGVKVLFIVFAIFWLK